MSAKTESLLRELVCEIIKKFSGGGYGDEVLEYDSELESYVEKVYRSLVEAFGEKPSRLFIKKTLQQLSQFSEEQVEWITEFFRSSSDPIKSYMIPSFVGLHEDLQDIDLFKVIADMKEAESDILSKVRAEAEDAPLGKYAFADERVGVVPHEPNNELEKRISDILKRWHHNDGLNLLTPEIATELQSILSKGLYRDVFKEAESKVMYRGMSVSKDWLKRALGLTESDSLPDEGSEDTRSFVFTPHEGRGASSWTPDLSVTLRFRHSSEEYHVLMTAKSDGRNDKKFLGFTDDFYDFMSGGRFVEDKEFLALSPVVVDNVRWKKNKHVNDDFELQLDRQW